MTTLEKPLGSFFGPFFSTAYLSYYIWGGGGGGVFSSWPENCLGYPRYPITTHQFFFVGL